MDKITILEAALKYSEMGLSVIPLKPHDKTPIPGFLWKKYQQKRATQEEIRGWFAKWPDANIGIATGSLSGIFTLDFDSPDAKDIWESRFEEMPPGVFYKTGRGLQYWFNFPSYGQGNKTAILPDIDIRGEGGYTVVPPSVHPNGKKYSWGNINPLIDGLDELSEMPAEMLKYCREARNAQPGTGHDVPPPVWAKKKESPVIKDKEGTSVDWYNDLLLHGAEKGLRNASATKLVGRMVYLYARNGISKEDMLEPVTNSMLAWNERNHPPLSIKEIETICKSIVNRHSFEKLSDAIGCPVFEIDRHKKKIGNIQYKIYTNSSAAITLSGTELANPSLFATKFMDLTKILIVPPKRAEWAKMITACLADCIESEETIEESAISVLLAWIMDAVERNGDSKEQLTRGPILIDGIVHITVASVTNYLKAMYTKGEWDDVKAMLHTLGFRWDAKQSPLHVGKTMVKTWRIPLEQLKNNCNNVQNDTDTTKK